MEKTTMHPLSINRIENIFFLNGIASLLGWNAVLGALDYFSSVWSDYNVYLYLPVPVFIAYAVSAIAFNWISRHFTYTNIVKVGVVGLNISLVLLVLFSILFKDSMKVGFALTLCAAFFLGFFSNFMQLSFFAMINYFGMQTVSKFTIGTAASGLMVILIRIIITGAFGDDQTNIVPIIIYFSLAIAFNFLDLWLNLRLFSTEEYKSKIQIPKTNQIDITDKISVMSADDNKKQAKIQVELPYYLFMWEAFKATTPYPAFIFFDFVITFMLFPNLTLAKKTTLSPVWTNIIMLLMYNIGDLAGKIVGDFRKSFNSYTTTFLFVSRLYFFYTIPLMVKQFTQDDHVLNNNFFPFFNQVLFAFTNGLVINGSFILAFEKAPNHLKKYAGVLGGILLQFGIMAGTFLAIPFGNYVAPDI